MHTANPKAKKRHIRKSLNHSNKLFLQKTISAQIHLLGLLAAMVGLSYLLYLTWYQADHLQFWACATFGVTAILVFGMSSVYHFLSDGLEISEELAQILEDLDHFAIYLFIAGTYTPVVLNTLPRPAQYAMIGAVWSIAVFGIIYTHFKSKFPFWAQSRFFSTGIFLAMGWVALVRIQTILQNLSPFGVWTLTLGGLSYTVGAVIYATKRPVLLKDVFGFHELWHVMVLLGFVFHYLTVLDFYQRF